MDKIQITLTTPVLNEEDQTPTPTKFLKQCEDIGLFNDLQKVNPFDETFKKAIDAQYSLLKYPLTVQTSEDTLNTPTPFQIVGNDEIKSEPLPLVLKHRADSPTKQDKPVTKKSATQQLNIVTDDIVMATEKNNYLQAPDQSKPNLNVCSSRITNIVDKIDHGVLREKEDSSTIGDGKTSYNSKVIGEQLNSTSECIKNFILTKKKNNKTVTIVENSKNNTNFNEQSHEWILKHLTSQKISKNINTSPIDWASYLNTFKSDNEGFDSMVERLEALNSIKGLPSQLSVPEIQLTPIPAPRSEKLPLPRKQSPSTEPPPVRKKSRELSEDEKRQQILERNRLAAKRSRERQKIQQHALELRLREKEKENKQLKLEIRNLKLKLLAKEQDIDQLAHIKAQEMLSRALSNS